MHKLLEMMRFLWGTEAKHNLILNWLFLVYCLRISTWKMSALLWCMREKIAITHLALLLWNSIWEQVKYPELIILVIWFISGLKQYWMMLILCILFFVMQKRCLIQCSALKDVLQFFDLFHYFVVWMAGYCVPFLAWNWRCERAGGKCKQSGKIKTQNFFLSWM